MKEKIIQNYVNNLSIEDIHYFALQNNIQLTNKEMHIIYKLIKNEWKTIIFGNPEPIFNQLKLSFDNNKYQQLYQLYQTYKNKYSHYL